MIKVVYNDCYGGFGLSRKAADRLAQLGVEGMDEEIMMRDDSALKILGESFSLPVGVERHDPRLVQVVEEFGKESSGRFADLKIDEIEDTKYIIDEYDGNECVQVPEDINWVVVDET